MRHGLRRVLTAAAVGCVLLTGCTSTVVGAASPGADEPTDVPSEEFPITGAADGPLDQDVRNAMADLYTFWGEAYPEFFGEPFEPLQGGVFGVDPDNVDPATYPDGVGCGQDPRDVENNAFFCVGPEVPNSDSITYDRVFLGDLADQFGGALVPVVLAHEFGHAIQFRFGFEGRSINQETQADCFAGAWTWWVVDGNAEHLAIRSPELDDVLQGYVQLRDPVGTDPADQQAHGSFFDRASGFSEGYDQGVGACRDNFGEDRLFTALAADGQDPNEGDAPYPDAIDLTESTLGDFWNQVFPALDGEDFQQPQIEAFDGTSPDCLASSLDVGFCADDSTVYHDEQDLTQPVYDQLGDFAVTTAISLPYALAAREQLGRSTDDEAATQSQVCLTGWYEAQVFSGAFPDVGISPGDVDEAVVFLLEYGTTDKVFPNTDLSGFELLRSYRDGFFQGGPPCDVGA